MSRFYPCPCGGSCPEGLCTLVLRRQHVEREAAKDFANANLHPYRVPAKQEETDNLGRVIKALEGVSEALDLMRRTCLDIDKRLGVLESQVRSLQMSQPKGIPSFSKADTGRIWNPPDKACGNVSPNGNDACTATRGHEGDHVAIDPVFGNPVAFWTESKRDR